MITRFNITRNQIQPLLIQMAVIAVSYIASFLLRFDYDPGDVTWSVIWRTLPLLVLLRMSSLAYFQLWRGLWRYVGVRDFVQIIKATTASTIVFTLLVYLIFGVEQLPRSVFALDWAANIFVLSGVRVVALMARHGFRSVWFGPSAIDSKRILIVGAGSAGAALCREMINNPESGFRPVAIVDDDPGKTADTIEGVHIVGTVDSMADVAIAYDIDMAVIAVPSATPTQLRILVGHCQRAGLDFKVLPASPDILSGAVTVGSVREVDTADLLGRPPAKLDQDVITGLVKDKRVLITGAAGSVGSELAFQVARRNPKLLVLSDISENSLFFLEDKIRVAAGDALVTQIVDITDAAEIRKLIGEHQPQVVLHAAAHKHVPFMEKAPREAVRNNIGGTLTVARAAAAAGVDKFVCISTDKAVSPVSVMGATKRVAELVIQAMDRKEQTSFTAVRFGNVIGSNASVVPVFKQQIEAGGPVTVTHPDMTRYFMSIPEAAALVLQAGAVSAGGEIFVLDMGDPVKIVALAQMMIELSGKTEEDIEVIFTGLRPGERLREDLANESESLVATGYEKLMVLRGDPPADDVLANVDRLLHELPGLANDEVKDRIKDLVPEYGPEAWVTAQQTAGDEPR